MSTTVEVRFLPANRVSRVPIGTTLFTAAHWIGLPIDSTCGGQGTCGKCRVKVEKGEAVAGSSDRAFLAEGELAEGWRLACRAPALTDTVCTVDSVLELPTTALGGLGQEVAVEPDTRKVCLALEQPTESDTRSDLERLQAALQHEGHAAEMDLALVRVLPGLLRAADFQITACLGGGRMVAIEAGDTRHKLLGVAFDVGTTTVVGTLIDLVSGRALAVESALNQQAVFGGDVISRIAHTMSGEKEREEMQQAIVGTLNRILNRLCAEASADASAIYEAVAVGNTTMLHLLLGVEARSIALAPFVPAFAGSLDLPAAQIGLEIHSRGRLSTLPAIGAYVGADTVAGLHATGLARQDDLWLFIDVGTNSEIALGSSRGVLATSAPAGPAFEGSCIRAGMAATRGAIDRVSLRDEIALGVVGEGPPRGICGSGLIDAIAGLRQAGLLDETGRLASRAEMPDHPLAGHLLEENGERMFALTESVRLSQRDVRELQSAKSSVATGVRVLMERLGCSPADLEAVLLAGSFGSAIDPASARAIGLVPEVALERVRFVGNAAAEGAKMALLSFRERQVLDDLASQIEYVELSLRTDFNDLFIEGLRLPPIATGAES